MRHQNLYIYIVIILAHGVFFKVLCTHGLNSVCILGVQPKQLSWLAQPGTKAFPPGSRAAGGAETDMAGPGKLLAMRM